MGLAAAARKIAASQVKKFGNPVTYTRTTPGTYDPATGTATPTTADYSVYALWEEYRAGQVDGSTVRATDRKAVIPALLLEDAGMTGEPEPGDKVASLTVVRLEGAEVVQGSAVLYTVQVRR